MQVDLALTEFKRKTFLKLLYLATAGRHQVKPVMLIDSQIGAFSRK
jgi:hypothetical protein